MRAMAKPNIWRSADMRDVVDEWLIAKQSEFEAAKTLRYTLFPMLKERGLIGGVVVDAQRCAGGYILELDMGSGKRVWTEVRSDGRL